MNHRVWFTQSWGMNPGLLNARQALYQLSYVHGPIQIFIEHLLYAGPWWNRLSGV